MSGTRQLRTAAVQKQPTVPKTTQNPDILRDVPDHSLISDFTVVEFFIVQQNSVHKDRAKEVIIKKYAAYF
jgi:hypothetical protein